MSDLQEESRPNGVSREESRDRPYVEIEDDRPVGAKERTGDGGTGSEVDVTEREEMIEIKRSINVRRREDL